MIQSIFQRSDVNRRPRRPSRHDAPAGPPCFEAMERRVLMSADVLAAAPDDPAPGGDGASNTLMLAENVNPGTSTARGVPDGSSNTFMVGERNAQAPSLNLYFHLFL